MDEPIWSRHFAHEVARTLGFQPVAPTGEPEDTLRREGEQLVADITEAFRYLPGKQVNWSRNLANFLRVRDGGSADEAPPRSWPVDALREVHAYMCHLRNCYGTPQPADEKDYWTDEDREDVRRNVRARLEERNPDSEDTDEARAG